MSAPPPLPEHLLQALVQTRNMASEMEMNQTIKRIVRDSIFPKAPFAADSNFDVDGKIFNVCAKAYKNSGGNKEHFKNYWQKTGGCLEGCKGSPKQQEEWHARQCSQAIQKV
jgi:hypothetical protein